MRECESSKAELEPQRAEPRASPVAGAGRAGGAQSTRRVSRAPPATTGAPRPPSPSPRAAHFAAERSASETELPVHKVDEDTSTVCTRRVHLRRCGVSAPATAAAPVPASGCGLRVASVATSKEMTVQLHGPQLIVCQSLKVTVTLNN